MPGLSHQPHVILNQAHVNRLLLQRMRDLNGQLVEYGYHVKSVQVDSELARDPESHPVTVITERAGKEEIFQAKYVLVRLVSFL